MEVLGCLALSFTQQRSERCMSISQPRAPGQVLSNGLRDPEKLTNSQNRAPLCTSKPKTICKQILRCRLDRARTDYKNKSARLQNSLARAMAKITSARPWKTVSGSARSLEPTACKTHRAPVIYDRMVGSWKSEKLSNLHTQILNVFFRFFLLSVLVSTALSG